MFLGNLQGLPPELSPLQRFDKSSFSYDDFIDIYMQKCLCTWSEWYTLQGLQKMFQNKQISFQNFQACFKQCEIPIQWRSA